MYVLIQIKLTMNDPYSWNFPQRNQTMYMSTIDGSMNSFYGSKPTRQSSFQKRDIEGASPKNIIPNQVNKTNYSHSSFIQPRPDFAQSVKKVSDSLYHHDIEYSYPRAVQFKSNRVVNPLVPNYKLPSSQVVSVAEPRKFLRDSINVDDIAEKKIKHKPMKSSKEEVVEKSAPRKLFRTVDAVSRLNVKDINTDGIFVSQRRNNPIDPLNPTYKWRDSVHDKVGLSFTKNVLHQEEKKVNQSYGDIQKGKPKPAVKNVLNREVDLSLNAKDIEGAHVNSSNENRYFFAKRRDYRDVMKVNDIDKTNASSLKKGITTSRNINPLIPNYRYPS